MYKKALYAPGEREVLPLYPHRFNSRWCWVIAGAVFMLYALLFPFYRLWHYLIAALLAGGAYLLSAALLPKETPVYKPEPVKPVSTGDEAADKAIEEGRAYIKSLAATRRHIASEDVQASLRSIENTVDLILKAIAAAPKKAPMVRRLMSYYLPTLQKLSDFYEKLEEQGGSGENVETSKKRIEENLSVLDGALKKQLDLLYENDALDITSDITVMENMLAMEGLKGGLTDTSSK